MEKRKAGNAPFYAAMAVCLLAAGVGTWQLLRPAAGQNAVSTTGRDAVGAVSQLPAQTAPQLPAPLPDIGGRGEADAAAVSGGAAVPKETKEEASGSSSDTGADRAAASGGTASGAGGSGKVSGGTSGGGASGANGSGSGNGGASGANGSSSSSGSASGANGSSSGSGGASGANGSGSGSGGASGANGSGSGSGGASGASGSASGNGGASGANGSGGKTSPLDGTAAAAFSMERLQYNETLGDWRTHDGLDITADLGTAVAAACAGTVASVTEDPLMGVTVTLRHDGGYETTYAGLQETSREAGDEIPAGGIVGTVGDTAAAEAYLGPHLHFSVRHGGVPMDPEEFLSGA